MRERVAVVTIFVALALSALIPAPLGPASQPAVAESVPDYLGGYGYDPATATMTDHNGFQYSYMPDGIIRLGLPWGYTTYFSFGLQGYYGGVLAQRTALDYTWVWAAEAVEVVNETGASLGYDFTFTARNTGDALGWTICLEFHADGSRMKVTHELMNGYPGPVTDCRFWYLFDLANTPEPYSIETTLGTVEGPLYQAIPESVHWVRLSNEFQFDWSDALVDYSNDMAYIGDGGVVGLPGLEILGISLTIGDIAPGATVELDPYFSGVTRTWNAAADGYSGIAANWDPVGVPATGDNITFDATSVYNCIWNSSVTVGQFGMIAGYTGTITQTESFGGGPFVMSAGTFLGSLTKWVYVYGDFNYSGSCVITYGYFSMDVKADASVYFKIDPLLARFKNTGANVTFLTPSTIASTSYRMENSGTINLPANRNLRMILSSTTSEWFNSGSIIGGTVHIQIQAIGLYHTANLILGNIDSNLLMTMHAASTINGTLTLGGDIDTHGNSFTGYTNHASRYYTIATSGYGINASDFTVSNRCILSGVGSTFNANGLWDTINGSYAVMDESAYLSGSSVIKTGPGQSFYDLTVSGAYTTASSVNISHDLTVSGTLAVGAGLSCDWNSTGAYSNTGTIDGPGTLYLTLSDDYALTLGDVACPVVVRKAIGSTGTHIVTLAVDTSLEADLTVESGVLLDPNDKVVTFTGDMDLNLSDGSTLWNCTIAAGVTLNLLADLTVELRATIDGTVTGEDLIQPAPAFTSSPDGTATTLEYYTYTVTQAYWDDLVVEDTPDWMYWSDGALVGTPTEADIGVHNVSLSLTWEGVTTYQNFTVLVEAPFITSSMAAYMGLTLSLVMGFGLLVVGQTFKMYYLTFFAGLVWLFSSVGLYADINIAWTVLSIALGFTLMLVGGVKIAGE